MNIFGFLRKVRDSDTPPAVKLFLVMLSTYYSPRGEIRPSIETLASSCGVSSRQLYRVARKAEALGWISRQTRRGKTTLYTLHIPAQPLTPVSPLPLTPVSKNPCHQCHPTPDTSVKKPLTPVSPKETIEETIEESPRVAELRRRLADRFSVGLHASTSIAEQWLDGMESSEISAALDDMARRIDYAISKGSPMRLSSKARMVCEVLEAHAETRPNRPELPLLSICPSPPTGELNPKARAILDAFYEQKETTR